MIINTMITPWEGKKTDKWRKKTEMQLSLIERIMRVKVISKYANKHRNTNTRNVYEDRSESDFWEVNDRNQNKVMNRTCKGTNVIENNC